MPSLSNVSVLFSEPKIPQSTPNRSRRCRSTVSVLFSEPKIPQLERLKPVHQIADQFQCSSASRKFLNDLEQVDDAAQHPFQCSSASRKFLNHRGVVTLVRQHELFQCSSASRKFLNSAMVETADVLYPGFSALQRAENSSIKESSSPGAE